MDGIYGEIKIEGMHKIKQFITTGIVLIFLLCFLSGCTEKNISESKDDESVELIWLVPDLSVEELQVMSERMNAQLAKDSYSFRVKFISCEDILCYNEIAGSIDADIAVVGFDNGSDFSIQTSQTILESGAYLELSEYIKKSKFQDVIPDIWWKSVELNGGIYSIPNLSSTFSTFMFAFDENQISDEKLSGFSGKPSEITDLLSEGGEFEAYAPMIESLYYNGYLVSNLVPVDENNECVNPFQLEEYKDWLLLFETARRKGILTSRSEEGKPAVTIQTSSVQRPGIRLYKQSEPILTKRYSLTTGIRKSSKHPREAFQLMELVMTDVDYGNLLIYGSSTDSSYVNESKLYYHEKLYFQINDFLFENPSDTMDIGYFKNLTERNDYYAHVLFREGSTCTDSGLYQELINKVEDFYLFWIMSDEELRVYLKQKGYSSEMTKEDLENAFFTEWEQKKQELSDLYDKVIPLMKRNSVAE